MSLLLARLAGGGPIVVVLGQVVETELSQVIKLKYNPLLGRPTETELAQVLKLRWQPLLGLPVETELAQALKVTRFVQLGLPLETEAALPFTIILVGPIVLGLPVETETAPPIKLKWKPVLGRPSERERTKKLTTAPDDGDRFSPLTVKPGLKWHGMATEAAAGQPGEEDNIFHAVPVANNFESWESRYTLGFNNNRWQGFHDQGQVNMITWEPWDPTGGVTQPTYTLDSITAGNHDTFITDWAKGAKTFAHPLFLRFAHEANGNWYPWCSGVNGNTSQDYIDAWQHVWTIFRNVGAFNVTWVWCPNIPFGGSIPMADIYPGNSYVDWLGIDGYNSGTDHGASWTSVATTFDAGFTELLAVNNTKPVMIAETGCSENGGDKAAWIADLFSRLQSTYTYVKGLCYFNIDKSATRSDWRLQTSSAATAAYADGVAAAVYGTRRWSTFERGAPLGLPEEVESAHHIVLKWKSLLTKPTETETARPVTTSLVILTVHQAIETEAALPIKLRWQVRLGQAVETEAARAVVVKSKPVLGLVVETELAHAVRILGSTVKPDPSGANVFWVHQFQREQQRRGGRGRDGEARNRAGRVRYTRGSGIRAPYNRDFYNPYPWMPSTDARVYIGLTQRRIPFSYRYFNAFNPYIKQLLPGWAPEFTLRDFKIVITVKGAFFGNIPAVIQNDVLAKVILEQDGWKVYTWHEVDIVQDIDKLFGSVPQLRNPPKTGGEYRNPFGQPDVMAQFRRFTEKRHIYISVNQTVRSRAPGIRRPRHRGGAFSTTRLYRDYRREQEGNRTRRRRGR